MRYQLKKLKKGKSTRAERIFSEILKSNHIRFRAKIKIDGREIDFLVGKNVFEIDSHFQDTKKNKVLIESGYNVYHLANANIKQEKWFVDWIKKICL